MAIHSVTISSDSDWFRVEITGAAVFVKGVGQALGLSINTLGPSFLSEDMSVSITDNRVAMARGRGGGTGLTLQVLTDAESLHMLICKGDLGSVRVESAADSVTNNQVTGDGQNCLAFVLSLAHAGKRAAAADEQELPALAAAV